MWRYFLVIYVVFALGVTGCIGDPGPYQTPAPDSGCCTGADASPQADAGQQTDAGQDADGSSDGALTDGSDAGDGGPVCVVGTKTCSGTTIETCADVADAGPQWLGGSTSSDPDNCGACGHSCQGGTCGKTTPLGTCSDVILASSQVTPSPIATDGTNVYWGTSNAIKSVPVGGGTTNVVTSGINPPKVIVLDGGNIYWIGSNNSGNVISMCSTTSCTPQPLWTAASTLNDLAVSGSNVYWTMVATSVGQPIVQMCDKTTCKSPTNLAYLQSNAQNGGSALGLAVDVTNVYWVVDYNAGPSYEIDYCAISGCSPTTLTQGSDGWNSATLIAVVGSNVYWGGEDNIVQCGDKLNPSNCVASLNYLATGQTQNGNAGTTQLLVDSTNVYWSDVSTNNNGFGDIRYCPINSQCGNNPTEVLATGPYTRNEGLAQDPKTPTLYWTSANTTTGAILKIAK